MRISISKGRSSKEEQDSDSEHQYGHRNLSSTAPNIVFSDFWDYIFAFRDEKNLLEKVSDYFQNYKENTEATAPELEEQHGSMVWSVVYLPGINTKSRLNRDKVTTLITQGYCMLKNEKCQVYIDPYPRSDTHGFHWLSPLRKIP